MALDETIDENDKVEEIEGIRFVYNSGLAPYFNQVEISYANSWLGKGFRILNRSFGGGC